MRRYGKTRVVVFNAPSAAMWGRPINGRRRLQKVLCGLAMATVMAIIMAIYVFNKVSQKPLVLLPVSWKKEYHRRPPTFHSHDGLDITWHSGLNSLAGLNNVLSSPFTDSFVVGGDVVVQMAGSPKPEPELVMAPAPGMLSGPDLGVWLDTVTSAGSAAAIKLKFKGSEGIGPALDLLASRATELNNLPVYISVDVVPGPGSDADTVSTSWLVKLVQSTYPSVHLVLGWSAPCCSGSGQESANYRFGRGSMESMLKACKHIPNQPIFISAPAVQVASSWNHFRWLLSHSERLSLLLTSSPSDPDWTNGTIYDLMTIRNDWSRQHVFYDIPEARLEELRRLTVTAGSPLHAFDIHDMDAARVTWAHGVDDVSSLERAVRNDVMMIEADVSLQGQGTPQQTDVPVMSHRGLHAQGNLTLARWLDTALTSYKGIKLDFKSTEVILPALHVLDQKRSLIRCPLWLNADIVRGPNAIHDPLNASTFLRAVAAIFPEVTLSLGWTSGWAAGQDNEGYSWDMVEKMDKIARRMRQPVTFAVRAVLAKKSWEKFDWLLRQSRRYTLTLWTPVTSSDHVTRSDLDFVRQQSERSQVYYDVPQEVMPNLH